MTEEELNEVEKMATEFEASTWYSGNIGYWKEMARRLVSEIRRLQKENEDLKEELLMYGVKK